MKKKLSVFLALLLGMQMTGSLSAYATETEEIDMSQDGVICVVKSFNSEENSYLLSDGCPLYQKTFERLSGENFELQYGDVLWLYYESIDMIYPPRVNYGENGKIRYLGNAKDYYKDSLVEMTLTKNNNNSNIYHWWTDDEGNSHRDRQYDYSEFGYVDYVDYCQMELGDRALCALDEDGDVRAVYPIENQESTVLSSSASVVAGDVDGNGEISLTDVLALNQYLLGVYEPDNAGISSADVNHDGNVDDADSMMLLKSLVGLEMLE